MNTDKIYLGDQSGFNEELRYQYDLKPSDLVLDIGSYRREFADKIISLYGCRVECFDALDQKAAWLYDGKLAMGGEYLYTSIHADKIDREYACVDIARYLQSEVALCKVNIEGGEYVLLSYMMPLIKNIRNLQVQFHLVEGMECDLAYAMLAEQLSLTHKLTWRFPFVWESWERL